MDQRDYDRIVRKYTGPRPPVSFEVQRDVRMLLTHIEAQNALIPQLRAEINGQLQTLLAICKVSGGLVEIPHVLVEALDARDRLHVTDIETAFGVMKRFSHHRVEGQETGPEVLEDPPSDRARPRLIH